MESLDSILKGKPEPTNVVERPAKAEEPKAEAPKPEEPKPEQPRNEKGQFSAKEKEAEIPAQPEPPKAPEAPKVETKPAPTAAEKAKPEVKPEETPQQVPVRALQEERRKRQALEQQLAVLQQPKAPPDVTTDPQGYQQHIQNDLQAREINIRVDMSAAWARKQYQDFDSVMESWHQLSTENPYLYQQAIRQELPAEWAYRYVKRHLLLEKLGNDPEAHIASEVERRVKEREAELLAKQPKPQPPAPVPPPSLATAQSAERITSAPVWSGPPSLTQILKRR